MPDSTQILLDEMRSLRADFQNFARDTGERVATLETHVHSLVDNGQPGRVTLLERSVQGIKQRMWWAIGACAGASGVVSVLVWCLKEAKQ